MNELPFKNRYKIIYATWLPKCLKRQAILKKSSIIMKPLLSAKSGIGKTKQAGIYAKKYSN